VSYIEVDRVSKSFGERVAINELSLRIERSERLVLFAPAEGRHLDQSLADDGDDRPGAVGDVAKRRQPVTPGGLTLGVVHEAGLLRAAAA